MTAGPNPAESSDHHQNGNAGRSNNDKASSDGFAMDPILGLTVEVAKGSGRLVRTETYWLAGPFEILGRVREPNSEGWAKLLRWRDDDHRLHEYPVSDADLHSDPLWLCARLASLGLKIATGPVRAHFVRYLNHAVVDARVTIFRRTGWHDVGGKREFVLHRPITDGDHTSIVAGAAVSPYGSAGSLQDWQASVGKLVARHNWPMLAVATAFAPPLLILTGGESGGFNLEGPSSIGKTTLLCAAASVWGRADEHGIIRRGEVRQTALRAPQLCSQIHCCH